MSANMDNYPASLSVDYPERLDRFTTLLRLFTAIPILIVLGLLLGPSSDGARQEGMRAQFGAGGLVVLPTVLLLLFRQKYPRWWYDWNVALTKFFTRVVAYLALLRDEYPSTDEDQAIHIDLAYPNTRTELNRWLQLVKWLLAIPHYVVIFFLIIAMVVVTIIAWFAILITGSYPRGIFDFVVGAFRWQLRVAAYAFLLITDRYPPFRLSE